MDKKRFGLFIKESRISRGYTQAELADLLVIDVTAVSKWERGVSFPDITLIPDICNALDISEHELIESCKDTDYRRMKKDACEYNKIKNIIFYGFSGCYLFALIIVLIVMLVKKDISTFFITFGGLLVGYSFIPGVTRFFKTRKLLIYLSSTLLSMFILFLICSIVYHDYWFMIAITGVLLGYVALFGPIIIVNEKRYNEALFNDLKKYILLAYSVSLLFITIVLELFVYPYYKFNLGGGILVTIYSYSILLIFGLVELTRQNRFIKISIFFITFGLYYMGLPLVIGLSLGGLTNNYYHINLTDWKNDINGNIAFIILMISIVVASILLFFGIKEYSKNKD